jgi:acetylglutamate kinase
LRFTVKLGGSVLDEAATRQAILGQVAELIGQGHEIILVHGGGKSLSRRLAQLGIISRFVDGLRVTDAATLGIAVMVLAGEVNKTLVSELQGMGCGALGICGADAGAVRCERLSDLPGAPQGLGFVGRPVAVNSGFFELVLGAGLVPVVSSIALGPDHSLYNVNADQMASICASGTTARVLIYLTDVPGVLGENGTVLERLGKKEIENLRAKGILSGGMLPKTTSCLEALENGVRSVHIASGNSPGILCRLIHGKAREGTHIHGNNE